MLRSDGAGVYMDPEFSFERGLSGKSLTVGGAWLELSPQTLNLRSQGEFVTAEIGVWDGSATAIEPETIVLAVGEATIPRSARFTPQLGDRDADGNPDLLVKFDRDAVVAALGSSAEQEVVAVQVRWLFADGTPGLASTHVRIVE